MAALRGTGIHFRSRQQMAGRKIFDEPHILDKIACISVYSRRRFCFILGTGSDLFSEDRSALSWKPVLK
ncbi:hypothetical protein [Mycobacterium ulcerans]|uniref:hypothetical protein n=1 Tax=Mycobacterium ulcerans TaxID=1809 RepID=UPI00138FCC3E|nr:hypothetical protein [Mycobacterium ulcerans]